MSQGGSLTINPETGLPEAGILKSLLPMIAGFFLGPAGIGLTAMQSALAVGALGTAATGSLGKGFMMGLGAYGGAGLGAGLTSAGASSVSNVPGEFGVNAGTGTGADYAKWMASDAGKTAAAQTGTTTAQTVASNVAPGTGGFEALKPQGIFSNPNVNAYGVAPTTVVPPAPVEPLVNASDTLRSGLASPSDFVRPTQGVGLQDKIMSGGIEKSGTFTAPESQALTYDQATPTWDASKPATAPSNWDKAKAGFGKATESWEGAKEVWNATPTGTGYGLAATGMGVLQSQQEEAAEKAKAEADAMAASRRGTIRPYEFSTQLTENAFAPRESSSEFKYYVEPRFIPKETYKVAKEGGLMSLAVGGQVEEMSAANAIGANTGYPMANLQTPMYTNPMMSRPTPTNVINPSGDAGVDAYSGELRMASGGAAAAKTTPTTDTKYSYDPATMKYTQTTTAEPTATNNEPVFNMIGLNSGFGGGLIRNLQQQMATPPTTTTQTIGGIAAPYMPPSGLAAANTSMVPNIPLQPQQNVDRQLGLEAFYPMMEQQLAMRGSNLQAQGYANGGAARGTGIVNMSGIEKKLGEKMFPSPNPTNDPKAAAYVQQKMLEKSRDVASQGTAAYGNGRTSMDYENDLYKQYFNGATNPSSSGQAGYQYNPATMQYTDSSGKITGGMGQSFMPPMMMQQLTPEQQIGLSGYQGYAEGGTANGGYSLGSYSDGGRLLRGPGDGVSDSIPASIGDHQPARLADGEFVVPARIVSEIGNGSTEAGARKLYAMMDRVQKARKKTVGKNKVAVNTKADKLLPA
jgi:hypothetical protein